MFMSLFLLYAWQIIRAGSIANRWRRDCGHLTVSFLTNKFKTLRKFLI
ncbi:MAG: hypothetical protein ACI9SC_000958 [Gammaproteobacteria bacterium]